MSEQINICMCVRECESERVRESVCGVRECVRELDGGRLDGQRPQSHMPPETFTD